MRIGWTVLQTILFGASLSAAETLQQEWAIGCAGILSEVRRDSHTALHPGKSADDLRSALRSAWGVEDRAGLIHTLDSLETTGHRAEVRRVAADPRLATAMQLRFLSEHRGELGPASLTAFDLARAIALARWGAELGWLSDDEAWARILPAARQIQMSFGSWDELGKDYLLGYKSVFGEGPNLDYRRRAVRRLLSDPDSPWVRLEWDLDLTARTPSAEEDSGPAATLLFTPHRDGLLCLALTVPKATDPTRLFRL